MLQHQQSKRSSRNRRPSRSSGRSTAACARSRQARPGGQFRRRASRLMGGKVRLPEPAAQLSKARRRSVRGQCRLDRAANACHDTAIHRRLQPQGQQARAVFEGVEQARVGRSARAAGRRRADITPCWTSASTAPNSTRSRARPTRRSRRLALMVRERLTAWRRRRRPRSWSSSGPR